jgi:1,2-dihydroxy-3-keto-5-methylthiopentene dioxygenase
VSRLVLHHDDARADAPEVFDDVPSIRSRAADAGVLFERVPLVGGAPVGREIAHADVLSAYAAVTEQLRARLDFVTADVVSVNEGAAGHAEMRAKFLREHTHAEDEIRLFVRGTGLFCIHHATRVLALECTAGDCIRVPAGTRHWFDMGPRPDFVAIRLFCDPKGWVAEWTGSDVASRFPGFAG